MAKNLKLWSQKWPKFSNYGTTNRQNSQIAEPQMAKNLKMCSQNAKKSQIVEPKISNCGVKNYRKSQIVELEMAKNLELASKKWPRT